MQAAATTAPSLGESDELREHQHDPQQGNFEVSRPAQNAAEARQQAEVRTSVYRAALG